MSKSENAMNTIYLADEPELLRKKIMKAKTDQGPAEPNSAKPDYIENLFTLMKLVSTPDTVAKFEEDYNNSSAGNVVIRYGDMKKQLAEDMVAFLTPIREKTESLMADKAALGRIMELGKQKASQSANETIAMVREAVGVKYY
jgi:tryptophanyl-tRNA synthetase